MLEWAQEHLHLLKSDSFERFNLIKKNISKIDDDIELRLALLDFISDFSDFDNANNKLFIKTANTLTLTAHNSLWGLKESKPFVLDSFAGGGAIPLESSRIGAEAFSIEYNSVAAIYNKILLEYIPKYGQELINCIEDWYISTKEEIENKLKVFYPRTKDNLLPIAYLWARTIISDAPTGGKYPIEVPLIRTFLLEKSNKRIVAIRWSRNNDGSIKTNVKEVLYANGEKIKVQQPLLEIFYPKSLNEIEDGTVKRNTATCPITGFTTTAESVRKQLTNRQGGATDARLYCVVATNHGEKGRYYRIPEENDFEALQLAKNEIEKLKREMSRNFFSFPPDENLPPMSGVFNAPLYGHTTWGSLFNYRQLLAINTYLKSIVNYSKNKFTNSMDKQKAVSSILSLILNKLVDFNSSLCVWQLSTPNTAHVFGRWALPMIMDFGEVNPISGSGGSPESAIKRITAGIKNLTTVNASTNIYNLSATELPLPDDSIHAFITDPPYYNAIPYADLSDYFYVWMKRCLYEFHQEFFTKDLSQKEKEICEMSGWDPVRYPHKDKDFFESEMIKAMSEGRRVLAPEGIGVIIFAHKSTTAWEAQLKSMLEAGWIITASWPIDTEMQSRLRAKNSAVLNSSVHIVCRPRENPDGSLRDDDIGDWRDVLQELPKRIHEWMPRLAKEGVVGADAIFACLGPALEIFSRYSIVEKANGEKVELKEYLEHVWAAVSKEALNMIFEGVRTEGFEEDSRITAMWLWTLSVSTDNKINGKSEESEEDEEIEDESDAVATNGKVKSSGFTLEYDAARKIAQGLGADLGNLSSIIEITGDKARLKSVSERVKYLFNKEAAVAGSVRKKKKEVQMSLFQELEGAEQNGWSLGDEKSVVGKTVLDKLHQAMILFGAGRQDALKRFLVDEGVGADEHLWRLAQSLSALYPPSTDEKRWVDGLLARKKGLGF